MHGPDLVSWLLAVLTAASGGYCLSRLRHAPCTPVAAPAAPGAGPGRLHTHEADLAEGLMGFGMAAMAVAGPTVPGEVWAWVYGPPAVVLVLAAARRPDRRAHRLHHAVGALAMTYMALAMTAAHGHAGHRPAAGSPALTGALLAYFGGYALWSGSRLLSVSGGTAAMASAGLARACRLSMGIGMFAMLLTM
ncbi:DUF5134 domain-containing protein [Kitasatospora purpeofusca]|uniref:DUF5134 domain-containing protein n=1 Tax=Kitasatospora purpeofusca TaxID=67352 RepID=UPI002A59E511|nr:DUF5134 domain-containing protein [Kitasatospora purpeofusca]MDY0814840.1 DUF5134 domain-containing protein [Kitasatospora purpeofusca]